MSSVCGPQSGPSDTKKTISWKTSAYSHKNSYPGDSHSLRRLELSCRQHEYRGAWLNQNTKRLSSQRQPQAMLTAVRQVISGENSSPVCRFTEKYQCWKERPGGGMLQSTVQSIKSTDTGRPGRKVVARRNIRRPSILPYMLHVLIWQNPSQNN